MKKALSLILVLVMCLSLCACSFNEDRIKKSLTRGNWYSDRETDNGTNRTYDYVIRFYDDSSYKLTYMSHTYNWPWKQEPAEQSEIGTWSIDGNVITLTSKYSSIVVKLTYSHDKEQEKEILTGPQSEGGYTYYRFSDGGR